MRRLMMELSLTLAIIAGGFGFVQLRGDQLSSKANRALELCFDSSGDFICGGGGGGVTGTGSANTVAKFTAATVLGDSGITDDGSDVTVSGNLVYTIQTVDVPDTGDATVAVGTITPTSSYVGLTCSDVGQQPGCEMHLSEAGAVDGQLLTVVLESTTFSVTWPDEPGVMLGKNPQMNLVGETVSFIYSSTASAWLMTSVSLNQFGIFTQTLANGTPNEAGAVWGASNSLDFEGSTANGFEVRILGGDPDADANIILFQEGSSGIGLDFNTVTLFANLPAAPDGTIMWCSNCDPGTSPCTGVVTQTGSFVFRENSLWECTK